MTLPVLFAGHGSPMNALERNAFTEGFRSIGAALPRPEAVLCVSAHWLTEGTFVSSTARPGTIHDFSGFPDELYRVAYPAPGAPAAARRVRELLGTTAVADDPERGLDHGTWSVLVHLFPEADVPVFQLSLDVTKTGREHVALARRLDPLRDEGILVVGSGNIVHNLRAMRGEDAAPFPWATEFDDWAATSIAGGHAGRLADAEALAPSARLAVPTPDHYWPLLYAVALRRDAEPVAFFNEGFQYSAISMRSLTIG